VELISTGGTASFLRQAGIPVIDVSDYTGFPEILDGRVKTLHPGIHGGLLAVLDNPDHVRQIEQHGISPIDMVVVNLYPFEQTVAREGVPLDEAIEQIDIGGPAMLRSAAKNFRHKAVIVDPNRYESVLAEMKASNGSVSPDTCFALAREVFRHTSAYDAAIAQYLGQTGTEDPQLPDRLVISAPRELVLRYGENPHQRAALYGKFTSVFEKLHGKELSYNNIADLSAAASLVAEFGNPAVVIVKHTNPSGVATGETLLEAYVKAFATDTKSPFGGIIAVNRPLDMAAAEKMSEIFTEVIVAPDFDHDVLPYLQKKKDRRIIRLSRSAMTN
jgi:phosphoribosylaminoimidazolecarboxamide formyltransferase/IMP cyclohydrolase